MKTPLNPPVVTLKRRATATGTLVGTRFQADLLEAIDQWRKIQPDIPTRPEAVRRLVEDGMAYGALSTGSQPVLRQINQQKSKR